ncbi:hypothetical protein G443_004550 [Actinoalloteichus cyanogriseus DSM 43889]|uniref:Uncharacterized protein n=1 Tax=Actinoalloteichus caeruleus DSM 43889 TaxID=1120930 RepID=A0ABT1JP26_ACTCY|nr:hypothetical protein [Actinoalloteichus caeruleus DSM 43889]
MAGQRSRYAPEGRVRDGPPRPGPPRRSRWVSNAADDGNREFAPRPETFPEADRRPTRR